MDENGVVMNETEAIRNEADAAMFYPWRRYLARMFDIFLYSTVWLVFLTFAFNVNLATRGSFGNLFDGFVALVLMLFIEPVWLHLLGTTPGKAIFGLHIMAPTGRRISYGEAMERTWGVLGAGMGYNIPVYNLVCLWRSYKRCSERAMQPWDEIGIYTIQDRKWYRGVIYLGVNLVLIGFLCTAIAAKDMPPNRGELSVAEFAENHNYFADYYALGLSGQALDTNGQWSEIRDRSTERISIVVNEPLEYEFTVEEGELTSVSFLVERENSHDWISSSKQQMILAALSFAGAEEEMGLHAKARREMVEFIGGSDFEDFAFEKAGISFVCKVEYSGLIDTHAGFLIPEENSETPYYRLQFTMQKSQ
jgi:hypothetical protein